MLITQNYNLLTTWKSRINCPLGKDKKYKILITFFLVNLGAYLGYGATQFYNGIGVDSMYWAVGAMIIGVGLSLYGSISEKYKTYMDVKDFTELGIEKIQEIFDQGWNDIEFIEIVFREWSKINQKKLDTEYTSQMKVERTDGDLDKFSLWLVDNIYLQVYCNGNDNVIVKEFCVKYFGYKDENTSQS